MADLLAELDAVQSQGQGVDLLAELGQTQQSGVDLLGELETAKDAFTRDYAKNRPNQRADNFNYYFRQKFGLEQQSPKEKAAAMRNFSRYADIYKAAHEVAYDVSGRPDILAGTLAKHVIRSDEDRALFEQAIAEVTEQKLAEHGAPGIARRFGRGLKRGISDLGQSLAPDQLALEERFQGRRLAGAREQIDPLVRPEDPTLAKWTIQAGQMAPQMAGAIGAGIVGGATGGPVGAAAGITAVSAPGEIEETYTLLRQAGIDEGTAKKYAAGVGTLSGSIEALLPNPLKGSFSQPLKRVLINTAKNYAGELTEEALQSAVKQAAVATATRIDETVPDSSIADNLKRVLDDTLEAAGPLAVTMGAAGGVSRAAAWAQQNPEAAAKLAAIEQPSRKDFQEAGLPGGTKQTERKDWAEEVRKALEQQEARNAVAKAEAMAENRKKQEEFKARLKSEHGIDITLPHEQEPIDALPQQTQVPAQIQPAAQPIAAPQENVQVEPQVLVEPPQPEADQPAPQVAPPPPASLPPEKQRRRPEVTPKQALDYAVREHVGDDPGHQEIFRGWVEHVYERNREFKGPRIEAWKQIRKQTGLTPLKIAQWERAGKDHSSWPNLDKIARSAAIENPDSGLPDPESQRGGDLIDYAGLVWETIRKGADKLPPKHSPEVLKDAYQLYRDNLSDVQWETTGAIVEGEDFQFPWEVDDGRGRDEAGEGGDQGEGDREAEEAGPQAEDSGVQGDRGGSGERIPVEEERPFSLQQESAAGVARPKKPDFTPEHDKSQGSFRMMEDLPGQETFFEDVDKANDDRPDMPTFGFGPGGGRQKQPRKRPDKVPSTVEHPDKEIEKRMQAAHGAKAKPLLQRITSFASHAFKVATRAQVNLPNNGEFATANEFFRLLKEIPQTASEDASRTVSAIVDPLGPKQLRLFERKLIIDNLRASIERGEPRRFGFKNMDDVEAYAEQLDALIEQTPEVQQALESRRKAVTELVNELVAHGILNDSAKENAETYYHQQVLAHVNLDRVFSNVAPRPVKRTFQKRRVKNVDELGPESDYNTSYLEAEATWLTDAMIELEKEKRLRALASRYGKQRDEEGDVPEGYEAWQPEPGNVFYRAFTIPEKVAEAIQLGTFDPLEMDPGVRQALALGGRKEEMILPVEIVAELRATEKPKPSGLIATLAKGAIKWWKAWTLFKPTSYVGYNLRNLTGDLDPVLGGNPDALTHVPHALGELYNFYAHKRLAMSADLRAARKFGVIDASMTATEIPDIKDLPLLRRFYENRGKVAEIGDAANKLKELAKFREAAMRYAAFLSYKKKLNAGTLAHYGGAKKEVVDTLVQEQGVDVAAAHLSRNLLGDYRNMTVAGDWLRQHLIPFHAWTEINMKRWPRMFINAGQSGKARGKGRALATAGFATFATLQLGALTAAMYAWNLLFFGDEEEELGEYERANPHLVLGRNSDGSIRVLRNTGALGDVLEWFGLNTALSLLPKYEAGQITLGDLVKESAKDPINKVVQGTRPDFKGAVETLFGVSAFPDVFNPRSIPRDEAAANVVGLRDEYRAAKGAIAGEGTRARPNYWQKFMGVGVSDPRRNAINDLYDLRERFLKQKGQTSPNILHESAFKPMREAAYADDYEAFKEARQAYLGKNKDWDNFKSSLEHLDPIHARLNEADEKEFETKFLNARQREQLRVARDFSMELKDRLIGWWLQANKEEGRTDEAIGDDLKRARKVAKVKFSYKRQKGETVAEYTERKRKHFERKSKAKQALSRLQASP